MHTARCNIAELILDNGLRAARMVCPVDLIPAPGQYLQVSDASDSPLPVSVFAAEPTSTGFLAAPPIPPSWTVGMEFIARGPIGRGFTLPSSARRVALIAYDDHSARLRGLINFALKQGAAITLVSHASEENIPDDVEVQPLRALREAIDWADYVAIDCGRENLSVLREQLRSPDQSSVTREAEILIRAPMPCGTLADCGVCALTFHREWKMVCKGGPVFDLNELE